tara:strand:+ start:1750 stop:2415 length:666 start_codon:yes stop_codon:yes gene_type:complete
MAKSNANSKLRNVKAIQDMLSGTHKSQTRQSHYYGKTSTEIPKEDILETFEDGKPKVWIETSPTGHRTRITQNDGFKTKESETGYQVRKLQKELAMPDTCPNCGQSMYGDEEQLNRKFWNTHKTCFDCVVKYETRLRNDPEAWEKYQKEKMFENAKSFFKDADTDVQELRKILTQELKNVQNADGELEVFNKAMSAEDFDKKVLSEYKLYKKNVLKGLKGE